MALTPGTRIGSYEITAQIGVGGMGEVYRATDTNLKRQVAIKVLPDAVAADAERLARFQREAEVLAALNHPNIAGIYGLEKSAGATALVMELVEGPTLADRIARGPIPVDEALPIARQIAEALEAAHEQGIVHRDLKPANVKVRPDGTVKVLDFGLARAMDPAASSVSSQSMSPTITTPAMTQAGIILGTAAYMSPEQAKGQAVDRRSDVFAFACVLYECLTGRKAFGGETIAETLGAVLHTQPDWTLLPPGTPPNVRRVLERCFQKDRRQRMRDMGDVALELGDDHGADPEPVPRDSSPLRWTLSLALVVLLAVGAYLAGGWRSSVSPEVRWDGEKLVGPASARSLVVSPRDDRIAFAGWDGQEVPQVWVMEPDVIGEARRLTTDQSHGGVWNMAWSPDGSRIFYSHYGTRTPAIWSVSAIGEPAPRRELVNASNPHPLSNGELLAVRINGDRSPQLIRYRPAAGDPEWLPVLLARTNDLLEQAIRVVPGEREAVVLGRPASPSPEAPHLWAVDLETYEMRRLAPDLTLPRLGWVFPLAVSEDDVYFVQPRRDLYEIVAVPLDGSSGVRTVLRVTDRPLSIDIGSDGSLYFDQITQPTEILRVDDTGAIDRVPVPSGQLSVLPLPGDRFLIVSDSSDQNRLMVVERGGSPVQFLTTNEEARGPLTLVGDDSVAFPIGPSGAQELAVATVDGILRQTIPIQGSPISGLSASPDGSVLYYVFDGMIYSVSSTGGPSEPVYQGDQVAVDPTTGELVVMIAEGDVRVTRVALGPGQDRPIAIESDEWWVPETSNATFTGGAVSTDGRAVTRILGPGSAYWPVGIFDARSGGVLAPPIDPAQGDMFSASWDREGRLVMLAHPFRSDLWRFRPESPE